MTEAARDPIMQDYTKSKADLSAVELFANVPLGEGIAALGVAEVANNIAELVGAANSDGLAELTNEELIADAELANA